MILGWRRFRRAAALALAVWWATALSTRAAAQTSAPTPTATPTSVATHTITGSVTGEGAAGGHLTVRISVIDAHGWRDIQELDMELLSGGSPVDDLRYEVHETSLSLGIRSIKVGTGSVAESTYFRVSGSQVIVTTGGPRMIFSARIDVIKGLPSDARFRLSAADYAGNTSSVSRSLQSPETGGGGVSWGTVAAAVAVALLAGGFVGNLFASQRRPPPRLSVYSTIQRRIEQERSPADRT